MAIRRLNTLPSIPNAAELEEILPEIPSPDPTPTETETAPIPVPAEIEPRPDELPPAEEPAEPDGAGGAPQSQENKGENTAAPGSSEDSRALVAPGNIFVGPNLGNGMQQVGANDESDEAPAEPPGSAPNDPAAPDPSGERIAQSTVTGQSVAPSNTPAEEPDAQIASARAECQVLALNVRTSANRFAVRCADLARLAIRYPEAWQRAYQAVWRELNPDRANRNPPERPVSAAAVYVSMPDHASCADNRAQRSKYATALEYLLTTDLEGEALEAHIREIGGISACTARGRAVRAGRAGAALADPATKPTWPKGLRARIDQTLLGPGTVTLRLNDGAVQIIVDGSTDDVEASDGAAAV